ncbi:uncharacterized protein B0H18DRAFT_1028222 [Fomitopsis serialis]|uniref:uncharacterized protein n=1 Tax=Fomitopsis serialis TaxID=139415 RepID=UPI002008DC16|nr:uncharacterized protein B0H18DRAFT_1028222 [Neoantrodia serialis]KAH9919298.1 hypothetical protein B0H18DRAFT_1028222 [Neoantrodia serialis]
MPVSSRTSSAKTEDLRDGDPGPSLALNEPEDDASEHEVEARERENTNGSHWQGKRIRLDSHDDSDDDTNNTPARRGMLVTLPLDILFEIFSLLAYLDLANLGQTGRAFYVTLTSPQASRLWRQARERALNAPGCPPGVSEVIWARFLHSPPECQDCGTPDIHDMDCILLKRLCDDCKLNRLIHEVDLRNYRKFKPEILKLMPHTFTSYYPNAKHYVRADMHAMMDIFREYRMDIHLQVAGAKEALLNFIYERVKYVRDVSEHARKCKPWLEMFRDHLKNEQWERKEKYYEQIVQRFKELGYETQDIAAIRSGEEAMCDREVTEEVWTSIKPILQARIEAARCSRLDSDESPTITARKALVKHAYDAYKRTLRPTEWVRMPPPEYIYAVPAFRTLIYHNLRETLSQAACDEAARRLPECVSAYTANIKTRLLRCPVRSNAMRSGQKRWVERDTMGDGLALAENIFVLSTEVGDDIREKFLFGVDDVTAHLAHPGAEGYDTAFWAALCDAEPREGRLAAHTLHYEMRSCAMLGSLIRELGLDPDTALPEDLDRLDLRVVCRLCRRNTVKYTNSPSDWAHTWRSAVAHWINVHCKVISQDLPEWRILEEDEEDCVRRAEEAATPTQPSLWSCNHCSVHLDNLQPRSTVVEHVEASHAIAEPEEDVDFFLACPAVYQSHQAVRDGVVRGAPGDGGDMADADSQPWHGDDGENPEGDLL